MERKTILLILLIVITGILGASTYELISENKNNLWEINYNVIFDVSVWLLCMVGTTVGWNKYYQQYMTEYDYHCTDEDCPYCVEDDDSQVSSTFVCQDEDCPHCAYDELWCEIRQIRIDCNDCEGCDVYDVYDVYTKCDECGSFNICPSYTVGGNCGI